MKIIFYIFVALLTASCNTAKLGLSDDLRASHDEYVVKGKDGVMIKQKLSFGEFHTTQVKRSWTNGTSGTTGLSIGTPNSNHYVNIISAVYLQKKQTVKFNLDDGKQTSDVYCVSRFNSKDLQIGDNRLFNIALDLFGKGYSSSNTFYIQIYTSKDDLPWQLLLDNEEAQFHSKKYIGYLAKSFGEFYTIHPATKMEINGKVGNTLAGAIGYEIRNSKGVTVAAVSSLNKGTVYLSKISSEERFLLANACAALLLQQHIDG